MTQIIGLDQQMRRLKLLGNPEQLLDSTIATQAAQSVRRLVMTTNKKTGGTRRGWTLPEKLGLSKYRVSNAIRTSGGVPIAKILDEGRKEVRPKNSKFLYIPISKRGGDKPLGAKIPKSFIFGKDYVLTKKARAFAGTKFIQKERELLKSKIPDAVLKTVRSLYAA